MMNPHINANLHSTPSQVSVIRFEEIANSQVLPLHTLEHDVCVTEAPLPLLIGSEEVITIENQKIPFLYKTSTKPYYEQFTNTSHNNLQMAPKLPEATKSLAPTKSQKIIETYPNKLFNDVIPKSSKRYAINKQIELYPSIYATKSPISEHFKYSNEVKQKSDPCLNEVNPTSFINGFLNQPLDALTPTSLDTEINPQPLNYTCKPVIRETDSDKSLKGSGQLSKLAGKRKVQNYVHISDVRVLQRAVAVLPTALQIRGTDNISPRRSLPMRIRFGPVEGIHKVVSPSQAQNLVSKADAPVFLLKNDDEIVHIDVSDKDKCNWMSLLPLGGAGEANVWLYQEKQQLFAITTEPINVRRPLKLGYSKKYAEEHKLPPGTPTLDLETVLSSNPKQWWCNECNRALPSAPLLQRHADVYHKDDIISTRRGYRCLQCRRMFSRLFTLRRHKSMHCTKKPEKPTETKDSNPPLELSPTLNNEDNRIPSDESFQNFTNALDFSTNLFDTDRISNLDISGNSRADDFNPYDITFRDDTCTSTDLSFCKLTSGLSTRSNNEVKKESESDTCTYCNQVIKKHCRRKHARECPFRRLECACGRSFRNSEKLSQHFLKEHPSNNGSKTFQNTTPPPEIKKYPCEQCKSKRVSFKRRGMLVNHLWRAHKIVSTSKVERPVRHYPCVACSKIYRSAAKRDRHISVHHPGAENLRVQSIEGGMKSCEPAACAECPRQYATRAKLLQHVRAQHPHAAYHTQSEKNNVPESITETDKMKQQFSLRLSV